MIKSTQTSNVLTKMHGLGNDFILMYNLNDLLNLSEIAKKMCDRNFGIGADGLITVETATSEDFDIRMRIMNSDGSEAEMCGNGIRCFAKYLRDTNYTTKNELRVETKAGLIKPKIIKYSESTALVEVDMGEPRLKAKDIPTHLSSPESEIMSILYDKNAFECCITAVSMGNPHAVILNSEMDEAGLDRLVELHGKMIESDIETFPRKINVEFVNVNSRNDITMRVYERGCGPTLACGTGACASVVACVLNNKTDRQVKVHLKGGDLDILWNEKDRHVYMTGPAQTVFSTSNYNNGGK